MTLLLGLGIIGSRSADQLVAAGHPLKTWNRTPRDRPDSVTDLVAAATEADVMVCYLRDDQAVREVFTQIESQLGEGKTFINHATIDPETTLWLERQCKAAGGKFLDAPFTGSRDAAAGGNLVYYIAGDRDLLEEQRPLLELTSREIVYLGQPPAATVVKITTNLATAAAVQALTEALEISRRHGVDPRAWHDAAKLNGCYAPVMGMKIPTLLENDFSPHFSTENMAKDTNYALQLADSAGITADLNHLTWARLFEAEMRDASEDFSATVRQHQSTDLDLEEDVEISCSRIRVKGADAERYLNGQVSNDVRLTEDGRIIDACLLDAKGKLQFYVHIHREGYDFIVQGPIDVAEEIHARLDKYLIADDVELIDESLDENAYLSVPNETRRIIDGIPRWPTELYPGILPPEAGVEEQSISYTKGCYTGQEVISRMKRAGKTNRHLVKLSLDKPLIPTKAKLLVDGREAGFITSVASHIAQGEVALGYRLRKFSEVSEFDVASPSSGEIIGKATIR
ncbi:NAD(P)-binding domain-containing protein [Akkermansiaceae bacterium]|nr:NAD(P)-binding domain-containing protein [Akkermansiaceae bacterium]MDA7933804.1 NAD(P)-binding domain-containing protein [Akkermansiaceae bacterium]MDA9831629.1 NAD(P)-binding domain-containing protein [Akkermansiaceae bacterium]MDB4464956.1 NAD(P)-binding domain-containing protein [Akkermansiaceae bacterium]